MRNSSIAYPLGSFMSVTLAPVVNVETENPFALVNVIAIVLQLVGRGSL